ncbi:MAG: hypothetical protein E7218_08935 [Anaerofustis stercorihominis]|nr:hypothetical protein [Anaerofustis stercorihominis]
MRNFFEEKGYTPSSKILIFDKKQLRALLICIAFAAMSSFLAAKLDDRQTYILILTLAAINLFMIMLRLINYIFIIKKFDPASSLPLHFCSFNVMLCFVGVVFNVPALMDYVFAISPVMALIALICPESDAAKYPHARSFRCWEYYYSHTCLILVPILSAKYLDFSPSIEYLPYCAGLFIGTMLVASVVNYYTKGNYMYISRAPHGTPFVAIERLTGKTIYRIILICGVIALYFIAHLTAPLLGI